MVMVVAVPEKMHQGAGKQEKIGQDADDMLKVLAHEKR
jgi:hypothetical protein